MNTERIYLPVPVWNGVTWEPHNFAVVDETHPALLPWPTGFDPASLPIPPVRLGQTVVFRFGHVIMEGVIKEIKLRGGVVGKYDDPASEMQQRYHIDQMTLTVYANGHGRWVSLKNLMRGVS